MSCTLTHGCVFWTSWMFPQILWKFILTSCVLLLEVLAHFMVSCSWLKGSSYDGLKLLGVLVAFAMILFLVMVLFLMFLSFLWCCSFLWCSFWWIKPPLSLWYLRWLSSWCWSYPNVGPLPSVVHIVDDELKPPPFLLCLLWSSS
jgi:hypothetical protein